MDSANKHPKITNTSQDYDNDLFETIACLYSGGQLSLDIAIHSSGLTRENILADTNYIKKITNITVKEVF